MAFDPASGSSSLVACQRGRQDANPKSKPRLAPIVDSTTLLLMARNRLLDEPAGGEGESPIEPCGPGPKAIGLRPGHALAVLRAIGILQYRCDHMAPTAEMLDTANTEKGNKRLPCSMRESDWLAFGTGDVVRVEI